MTSNLIDYSVSQPTGAQAQGGIAAQQYGISPGQSNYEFVNSAAAGTGGDTAALMSGSQWQVGAGGKTVITFSFSNSASVYGFEAGGFSSSLMEFSAADKAATRELLHNIEAVANVQFVEVADNGSNVGQVRYAYSQAPNSMGYAGFAFFPSTAAIGGDVWIGKAQAGAEWAYYRPNLILHETLHAIGLKHPFDGAATLGSDDNVIANTVMSYSPIAGATSGALSQYPGEPMPLDVKALQEMYGAATHNEGNTVYNLATLQDGFHAIWDSAGVDTLDAGSVGNSVAIDLHAGARSDIGASVQAFGNFAGSAARSTSFSSTLALASNAQIENANGSAFDDVLLGNDGANVLSGGAGNDLLIGAGGNDRIIGGDGVDTAGFAGAIANFRIEKVGNEFRVTDRASGQGVDTLSGVEKLRFQEMSIDLTVQDAAAAVAQAQLKSVVELYVGFFNRVPDAEGLSYWLDQMSQGMTTGTVAENFYAAAQVHSGLTGYTADMSNADFVKVIYKNVLGRTSVDAEGLGYWSNALANGSESRGSLLESILASAHTFKGNAQYGYVADLLANKFVVGKAFAVDMGLTWNTADQSITKGMEIAAAVTANDITAALHLIGVAQNDVALG